MPTITFILLDGEHRALQADVGMSVMEVARNAGLRGIAADCGGECQCATCHVYIDDAHLTLITPANETESDMLEGVAAPFEAGSRLSCQVIISDANNGMVVRIPAIQ